MLPHAVRVTMCLSARVSQESRAESVTSYVPALVMLALMLYVVDFYVESISANRWDGRSDVTTCGTVRVGVCPKHRYINTGNTHQTFRANRNPPRTPH